VLLCSKFVSSVLLCYKFVLSVLLYSKFVLSVALYSKFVSSVALCYKILLSVALCYKFVLSVALCSKFLCAGMAGMWLLKRDIDSKHRSAICSYKKLEPLVTRTSKEYWKIHPQWVDRYVLYLFPSSMYINGRH
jgi:hypothetical protein